MHDEQAVIKRAIEAVADLAWVVGECAFEWTRKWARGRTDQDFAELVGSSVDQINTQRRVWEMFGQSDADSVPVRNLYPDLVWSHFLRVLAWDDRTECLEWAQDNRATVAQMQAWRRMCGGGDLTIEATPDPELAAAMSPAATAPQIDQPTHQAAESPAERSESQQLKTIILKIRRAAREAQQLFGSETGSLVLADELAAISDDLRQGENVSGLDDATLSAGLERV